MCVEVLSRGERERGEGRYWTAYFKPLLESWGFIMLL